MLTVGGGAVSQVVMVCAGVTITNKSNAKLTYADLKVGDKVTVGGYYTNNTMTILATTITQNSKTPAPSPTVISKPGIYSNLSSKFGEKSASFSFSYSGTPAKNFYVAMSTDPKMLTDVYLSFAQGPGSPVSQNNPTKWDKYSCGRTLHWRVTTEYPGTGWASYKPELMSPIASGAVTCQ